MVRTHSLSNSITCAVLIDGFRHDYVNKNDSPFLHNLQKSGASASMKETFAFQTRPAFFAGLYPDECDIATFYAYEPDRSPFAFTKFIPKPFFNTPLLRRYTRHLLRYIPQQIERGRGNTAAALSVHPQNIPYELLKYFSPAEKKLTYEKGALGEHTTIFDQLRENNKDWLWLSYPTHDQKTEKLLQSFHDSIQTKHDLAFLHFAETDWAGHEFGPNSVERKSALREIDTAIEDIHSTLSAEFTDVKMLVFGDHGMVEVTDLVDVKSIIEFTSAELGKDYICFLDSTQARFWFRNNSTRKTIRGALRELEGGHILSQEEKSQYHHEFGHNKFGEITFVADAGNLIFPNFFQKENPPKGMHGYTPDVRDNNAALIVQCENPEMLLQIRERISRNNIDLTDVYPILRTLMKV